MTLDEALRLAEKIADAAAAKDNRSAHLAEDALNRRVLMAIANGASQKHSKALAEIALRSLKLTFIRGHA